MLSAESYKPYYVVTEPYKPHYIAAGPYEPYYIAAEPLSLIRQWEVVGLVSIYTVSKTLKKRLFFIKLSISKALN